MKSSVFLRIAILFLTIIVQSPSFAQNNPAWKADRLYAEYAYSKAIPEYEKVLEKHPDNVNVMRKLADCYRLVNDNKKAEEAYARLVQRPDALPIEKLYYAQALMYNGKYSEAQQAYDNYELIDSTDERALSALSAIEKMEDFYRDSARAKVQNLSINTDKADFSPVMFNGGIVFVSSRETGVKDKTHSWTGNPFLTLYYATGSAENFKQAEAFSKDIISKYNDGPACFSPDGKEMYFTRNNSQVSNKKDKIVKLKIVIAKLVEGKWVESAEFPFNNIQYSCAHAWLTKEGNRVYFSSDMPGGFGGMDLYYTEKTADGWGKPVNLGKHINTKGNEVFPFVNEDGTLYFASNGHVGLGGLDIYESKANDTTWSEPVNMGYPINTNNDDFGLVLDRPGINGYMSSNRSGGKGDDDIYAVQIFRKVIVSGVVSDKTTGLPLELASVTLLNKKGKEIGTITTGINGAYEFELDVNEEYSIVATKPAYSKETKTVSTINPTTTHMIVDFQLEKLVYGVEGIVYDKETKAPITGATVALVDPVSGKELATTVTAADGYYYFSLEADKNYKLRAAAEGYFAKSDAVSTIGAKPGIIKKDLPLDKLILNKPIRLDNIYYDLAKWNIRPDAAKELDKLVQIMRDNPTIVIELSSHTDSRASDAYNMKLSEKRAQSAVKYIIEKGGIDKSRITAKGYGETMLINRCANGVKCSEKEHQENRRTEFKVLKL
ncbi:MAG TPA: carboxypeptidase regulatory-like domain-containing protein [Bacteroidia bacterium]|nr:carboxypeptidase regulatory-like domain-containing protein [Bacteroidia bacterium]